MDAQKILEDYLNEMQDAHKEFYAAKNGLLDVVLLPFESLFMKDTNGEPLTKKMKDKDKKEIIKSFDEDILPMFEESKYTKGIEKVNEWKKLLEEN